MHSDDERAEDDRRVNALVEYIRSLGLERMARDISDERIAGRIHDRQLWINSYDIQKSIEDDRQENIEQRFITFQAQLFDKAANYNNIVITFGYAGFFAIWNFVSDRLHSWDTALIALLLGSSLLVFIFWTLSVSFHNAFAMRKLTGIYLAEFENTEDKIAAIVEKESKINLGLMRLQRIWLFVFFFTVATGFSAGLALIVLMLCRVLGIDFDLFDIWIAVVGPPTYEI
ncbi:hypothetical protein PEL8287_01936 [Roseovarius litorisediminis]|uniref:Uncharacterized protein n=1 Tax=Roseovarius litorisediminis TaxID=1312363 RepID=A0A1Y5SF19_9RHOB|nr:hypothetical protein [Roseovarius litorisediminis]SLN39327.1 hypothetical protein PEL8287_01936 [Roseovarius litorisediminis]